MTMSNYFRDAIGNAALRNTAYTSPTTVYLALSTATITAATTGSTITEPSSGYSRQAIAFDAPSPNGVFDNSALESFTASGGNWGSITDCAIIDAATLGNILVYSTLTAAKTVNDTDTLEFAAGAVVVTFS